MSRLLCLIGWHDWAAPELSFAIAGDVIVHERCSDCRKKRSRLEPRP